MIYNYGDGESVELIADDVVDMKSLVDMYIKLKEEYLI